MIDEVDVHQYLDGGSHVMAIAIKRMFGGRFVLFCEDDGEYFDPVSGHRMPTIHHVCVELTDGRLVDVSGVRPGSHSLEQWEAMGDGGDEPTFLVVRMDEEQDLMSFVDNDEELPLGSFTEADVDDAGEFFLERNPGLGLGYGSMLRH